MNKIKYQVIVNVSFLSIQRNTPKTSKHSQQKITRVALVSTMPLYKESVAKQGRNIVYMKME